VLGGTDRGTQYISLSTAARPKAGGITGNAGRSSAEQPLEQVGCPDGATGGASGKRRCAMQASKSSSRHATADGDHLGMSAAMSSPRSRAKLPAKRLGRAGPRPAWNPARRVSGHPALQVPHLCARACRWRSVAWEAFLDRPDSRRARRSLTTISGSGSRAGACP